MYHVSHNFHGCVFFSIEGLIRHWNEEVRSSQETSKKREALPPDIGLSFKEDNALFFFTISISVGHLSAVRTLLVIDSDTYIMPF